MFKFLHAADIHLDSPLRGLAHYEGCPVDEIRGATRRALDNLIKLAIDEKVAFVLIAGDVYDGDWQNHETGIAFANGMGRLFQAKIPVFLIRGNHDAQNLMTKSLSMPKNVKYFGMDHPEFHSLAEMGVVIHGQSFASQWVREDLAANYPRAQPGCFNVGLLHTCIDEGKDYAPCTVESLRAKGYDYWALGHVHDRRTLCRRYGPIEFPGNIQGRHIGEQGAKGCLLVTVDGNRRAHPEFRALDVLRWETCHLDASTAGCPDDVAELFGQALHGLVQAAEGRLLALRVVLVGESPAHARLMAQSQKIHQEIRSAANIHGTGQVWVEKLMVNILPPRSKRIGASDGPLAELDRVIDELQTDARRLKEFAARELEPLRRRLASHSVERENLEGVDLDETEWLGGILNEIRSLLVDRLGESREGVR